VNSEEDVDEDDGDEDEILIVVNEGDIESYCNNAKHALQ